MKTFQHVSGAICAVLSAACVCLVSGRAAFAQNRSEAGTVNKDSGPQLRLSVSQTDFRCGEIIPLVLEFTSPTPERYQINLATYDRSGRMSYEQFLLDPREGSSDPLALYFNSIRGFLGGGLTGFKFLSSTPVSIHLDLNEWVRFDRPGTYLLTVVSRRVTDTRVPNYPRNAGLELRSNPVELRVTEAGAAWQHAQFEQFVRGLDKPGASSASALNDPSDRPRKGLRYLGSEEAAREMARRLRGEDNRADWDYMFGLIGSPHRAAGLEEMNRLLKDPEFPVCDTFLWTMAILPLDSKDPPESLRNQRDENMKALRQRLVSVLPNKHATALAVSLDTALSAMAPAIPDEVKGKLLPQFIATFPTLPVNKQVLWLEYRWPQVSDPRWAPLLRVLALQYEDFPQLREMHAYESLQLSAAALRRWYELDPAAARGAVLAEITRPKPRYGAAVLGLLPDQTLPAEEHVIASHFVATGNYEIEANLASLLFRYADQAVLPVVLPKIQGLVGRWACESQDQALAYVLKVDPQSAKPLIERAIAARGPEDSACRHMLLTDIGALESSPVLEEIAVKSLADTDTEVANDAANFLGKYGAAGAEQSLWDRYEAWNREWSGRAGELRFLPVGKNPHTWDANLGQSLARALAAGTNWMTDDEKLQRIQALGVGANIHDDLERDLQTWSRRPFLITYFGTTPPRFELLQYTQMTMEELQAKLKQFPAGTRFVLPPSGPAPSPDEKKIREEMFQFAGKNGIPIACAQ